MPAPTFRSVTQSTVQSMPTVAQYVQAYDLWVRHTILDPVNGAQHAASAMGMGKNVLGFLKMAQKGATEHAKMFNRSLNVG